MRKTKTVRLTRGWLTGEGKTKTEAKADLEKQIDWACSAATLHVEKRYDRIIVIAATPNGWSVMLVEPGEMMQGSRHGSSCSYGHDAFEDVLASARNWAAQIAWTLDCDNDDNFADESGLLGGKWNDLRRWMKWQRSYAALIKDGKTPAEAHQLACGY
jgi:hypothetical protein